MKRKPSANLSLFGDEEPAKPEPRSEKRAKQAQPLRADPDSLPTMQELWARTDVRSSRQTKSVHLNTSGPFGGSTTHAACGAKFGPGVERAVLVEYVTCLECRAKAARAWEAMARYSRGIEEDRE